MPCYCCATLVAPLSKRNVCTSRCRPADARSSLRYLASRTEAFMPSAKSLPMQPDPAAVHEDVAANTTAPTVTPKRRRPIIVTRKGEHDKGYQETHSAPS